MAGVLVVVAALTGAFLVGLWRGGQRRRRRLPPGDSATAREAYLTAHARRTVALSMAVATLGVAIAWVVRSGR